MSDAGIYLIRNKVNGKVYIGQSIHLKYRMSVHKRKLSQHCHPNPYLQHSYDVHGVHNFEFRIIERCEESELDEKERYWISYFDSMNRDKGYNRESGGKDGRVFSEERIEAITGEGNPMYGRKHTEEARKAIQTRNRGQNSKLTVKAVTEIKQKLAQGVRQSVLAKEYGVVIATINKIARGKNWEWVESQLNEVIYQFLDKSKEERDRQLKELFEQGKTITEAAHIVGCAECTANRVLRDMETIRRAEREKLIASVEADFIAGMTKEEIMEKYHISQTSFSRYTSQAYQRQKQALKEQVKDMYKQGAKVKDIAQTLGLHRTTVTEYLKEYRESR